ncbi:response regulator receiver protein [Chondrocystis sp. NIES-4102]|nr:response regulator receiver protein [Chondrocystis sp. NIES-4102]
MNALNQIKQLKTELNNAVELQQTCKIYVAISPEHNWSFYFKKGYLIWASSSIHRFRRLYRITQQLCPQLNCQSIRLREQEISELWEYLLISVLYKRQIITIVEIKEIVQEIIKEVLFDCLLADTQITTVKVIFGTQNNNMGAILNSPLFKQPIIQIEYKKTIHRLELQASDWKALNINNCSPNLAPVIIDINKLKKEITPEKYQQIFMLINGKKTLRDLAIVTKLDVLKLIRTLAPQIKNKAIALQQIPDQQLNNLYFVPKNQSDQEKYNFQTREYIQELELPLVICVDNNPKICQKIAQILNPAGYRIIPVNDAAKTLLVLLENQPDLIIMNATMPDASGYELSTQIRKMPSVTSPDVNSSSITLASPNLGG